MQILLTHLCNTAQSVGVFSVVTFCCINLLPLGTVCVASPTHTCQIWVTVTLSIQFATWTALTDNSSYFTLWPSYNYIVVFIENTIFLRATIYTENRVLSYSKCIIIIFSASISLSLPNLSKLLLVKLQLNAAKRSVCLSRSCSM